MATREGNRNGQVVNPGVNGIICSSVALDPGRYKVDFTGSSSDGSGTCEFVLFRNSTTFTLVPFQESNGGLNQWDFEGDIKAGDIFRVISTSAAARTVFGSVTWIATRLDPTM